MSQFKQLTTEQKELLQKYPNAFKNNQLELYQAATTFFNIAAMVALSVWVYLSLLIVEKVIGWF